MLHLEGLMANRSMAILMQTEVRQSAKFIAEFSHRHLARYIQMVREAVQRGQQRGIFRKDLVCRRSGAVLVWGDR